MKGKYIALIAAGAMMIVGAGITFGTIASHGFDYDKMSRSGEELMEKEYPISGSVKDIYVKDAAVKISPSADGNSVVKTLELPKYTFEVTDDNGKLSVIGKDKRVWTDYIFNVNEPEAIIYIPEGEYNSLLIENGSNRAIVEDGFVFDTAKVDNGSGSVKFFAGAKNEINLHSGSGSIAAEGVTAGFLNVTGGSGSIKLIDVKSGDINVKDYSGSVKFEKVECDDAVIDSGSGSVALDALRGTSLNVKVSSGSFHLDDSELTGGITAKDGSGSIHFNGVKADKIDATNSSGSVNFTNVICTAEMVVASGSGSVKLDRCDAKDYDINASSGSVKASILSPKNINASSSSGSVNLPDIDDSKATGNMKIRTGSGSIRVEIAE
ncbi:MAG: DUF4097 family beta strand repeat protein [Lachnospiraceae bacterium]|nr:DUF4097 family beta strand repeat protein [Lachnospiraceae bacterium]